MPTPTQGPSMPVFQKSRSLSLETCTFLVGEWRGGERCFLPVITPEVRMCRPRLRTDMNATGTVAMDDQCFR